MSSQPNISSTQSNINYQTTSPSLPQSDSQNQPYTAIPIQPIKSAPLISIISMIIINIIFYGIPMYICYLIYTLNWQILSIMFLITLLQHILIKQKSEKYITFCTKYLKLTHYMHMERIYDGGKSDLQALQVDGQQRNDKILFCYHPHSIFGYGIMLNNNNYYYQTQKLSYTSIIGSNFALLVPIIGLHLKLWGITGADTNNFKSLLQNNKDISLLPGGFQQATITSPKQLRIYIKKRKGFIKYALMNNYTIRHVLVLNEHKIFNTFDYLLNFRLLMNKVKIPGTLFWGTWGLLLPKDIKITVIVGKAMRRNLQKNGDISNQEIQEFHQKYIEQLVSLYGRYKDKNGNVPIKIY